VLDKTDSSTPAQARPVVLFLSGGGWTIGYKDWGSWIGMMLAKFGVIAVVPDYRNYPQATVDGMMDDVTNAVQWTIDCIGNWGGDINQIHLVGQSAGAHLAVMSVLTAAFNVASTNDTEALRPWTPAQLKSIVAISGAYNLESLCNYHLKQGLELSGLLNKIMLNDLTKYSPTKMLSKILTTQGNLERLLPPVRMYHGKSDMAIPHENATEFHELLCNASVDCELTVLEGKTHTDLIIEDPIGGNDILLAEILKQIYPADSTLNKVMLKPMVLSICVRIARVINPF